MAEKQVQIIRVTMRPAPRRNGKSDGWIVCGYLRGKLRREVWTAGNKKDAESEAYQLEQELRNLDAKENQK